MNIVVCVRRVPDLTEAELEIAADGLSLDDSDLDYDINEWDDFAIEAAVQLKEEHGGSVLAITVGDEEAEEVLRHALAMGVDEALHVEGDELGGADPWEVANALHRALEGRRFDLVLTGAMSSDGTSAHTGGMLAALLDVPQVALATGLEVDGDKAIVRHEVEGGLEREVELTLPALVTVQSGINEPRYVSIRGIRKVAGVEIATMGADAVDGIERRVKLEKLALPPTGDRAEILGGDVEEAVATLVERLHEKGGL